ncbi:MAG: hypothetical protein NT121_25795 [Chloroflexi bacterium]|nr:hypothetical protein [Chloroflexota bacterium]
MDESENADDDEAPVEIDQQLWLQVLLAILSDPVEKEYMLQRISSKSGIVPEKVELIMKSVIEYLFRQNRLN